jgi:predicted DNA-binding transcriptional regulator AlpA
MSNLDRSITLAQAAVMPDQMMRLLNADQVTEMMGISRSTLGNRISLKKKPLPIDTGKTRNRWLFRLCDVVEAMDTPRINYQNHERPHHTTNKKKNKAYGIQLVSIQATCPYCSVKHTKEVVAGSSRWIYCPAHEYLRNSSPPEKNLPLHIPEKRH